MKVEELHETSTGEATAEYEVVVEAPGVQVGNQPRELWTIGAARRDTVNKRLILTVEDVIEKT
jgi:hypothetical protein